MKRLFIFGFLAFLGFTFFLVGQVKAGRFDAYLLYSSCDQPIYYTLGEIDSKFGLNENEFLLATNRAVQVWNQAAGQNLFLYSMDSGTNLASQDSLQVSPAGGQVLEVNFKYDKRQALTSQIGQLEGKVYKSEDALKADIAAYDREVADFNAKMEQFNAEVQDWNSKGGAPPDVYEHLRSQQASLQDEAARLNTRSQELGLSVEKYNKQVGKLNQTIESFNTELTRRPEEGLYDANQNKIEIFFFFDKTELLHTLIHEFGHARGLEHVDNEQAIMFPFTTNVLKPVKDDLDQLEEICARRSVLDDYRIQGELLLEGFKERYLQNFKL